MGITRYAKKHPIAFTIIFSVLFLIVVGTPASLYLTQHYKCEDKKEMLLINDTGIQMDDSSFCIKYSSRGTSYYFFISKYNLTLNCYEIQEYNKGRDYLSVINPESFWNYLVKGSEFNFTTNNSEYRMKMIDENQVELTDLKNRYCKWI